MVLPFVDLVLESTRPLVGSSRLGPESLGKQVRRFFERVQAGGDEKSRREGLELQIHGCDGELRPYAFFKDLLAAVGLQHESAGGKIVLQPTQAIQNAIERRDAETIQCWQGRRFGVELLHEIGVLEEEPQHHHQVTARGISHEMNRLQCRVLILNPTQRL